MATSYPASCNLFSSSSTTSLENFYPSHYRGTAASLPALLQPLPEMEDLPEQPRLRRRDRRSLTPTRRTRPQLTRTLSGDDESFTFRSERNLANPRKPNEMMDLTAAVEQGTTDSTNNGLSKVKEENEDEEQYRRHSKDDEQLFRSGRRRSI